MGGLAIEFLREGFNVALLAPHQWVLREAFGRLRAALPPGGLNLTVLSLQADLGDPTSTTLGKIRDRLAAVDVAVVVHDAGLGQFSLPFSDVPLEENRRSLNRNGVSPVLLTQALIPELRGRVASAQAKRSAVL